MASDAEQNPYKKIQVLLAGISALPHGEVFKSHAHPYYQLTHVIQGNLRYTIGHNEYRANPRDTVFIPTNVVHSIDNIGSDDGYYFEAKFFSFSNRLTEICADIEHWIPKDEFTYALMRELADENNNQTPISNSVMETYLLSVIFKLSLPKRREKTPASKYIEITPYSAHVRDVIRFLENNYMRQLTLDDIVKEININKSHLCSIFKKETGVTVFDCLMIIRVRKAVEMLTYTQMTLSQISQETGFINTTHFNRVYTKHLMIPPGQFRKHLTSQDHYWKEAIFKNNNNPIASAIFENKKIDIQYMLANGE